jgi:hypothetical protein
LLKLITNRSIYELKITSSEGHIKEIIKAGPLRSINPIFIKKRSSLKEIFPLAAHIQTMNKIKGKTIIKRSQSQTMNEDREDNEESLESGPARVEDKYNKETEKTQDSRER